MKKLLIYIAAFAMILAMNTSCEDMGSLEEHPKKVDATTFMANAKEVESVINSIYFQLRRDPGFSRYLIVLEEGLADYCIGRGNYATAYDTGLTSGGVGFSKDSWAVLYRAIRFANNILDGIGILHSRNRSITTSPGKHVFYVHSPIHGWHEIGAPFLFSMNRT